MGFTHEDFYNYFNDKGMVGARIEDLNSFMVLYKTPLANIDRFIIALDFTVSNKKIINNNKIKIIDTHFTHNYSNKHYVDSYLEAEEYMKKVIKERGPYEYVNEDNKAVKIYNKDSKFIYGAHFNTYQDEWVETKWTLKGKNITGDYMLRIMTGKKYLDINKIKTI